MISYMILVALSSSSWIRVTVPWTLPVSTATALIGHCCPVMPVAVGEAAVRLRDESIVRSKVEVRIFIEYLNYQV